MPIVIKPYTEELIPAVKQFNLRLLEGGIPNEFRFPETHIPHWLPKTEKESIYQEYFLATEGDSVRGGYIAKRQDFSFNGVLRAVTYYHLPLSEGIVRKSYVSIGMQMLKDALKRQPLMFALGMGGTGKPLPRMLTAMGWNMCAVPFFFRAVRPARVFRQLNALRETWWKRLAMDVAASTGAGFIALKAAQRLRERPLPALQQSAVNIEPLFGSWADELWGLCKPRYAMIGSRDSATLQALYPEKNSRFLRVKVSVAGKCLGWAVLLDTSMNEDKYFGNLRVGSIVDCLALPENAPIVVSVAARLLKERGVDLIVSNQLHTTWCGALQRAGFLKGPSNFIFATSKPLGDLLSPFDTLQGQIHINRGDGDGPIHL